MVFWNDPRIFGQKPENFQFPGSQNYPGVDPSLFSTKMEFEKVEDPQKIHAAVTWTPLQIQVGVDHPALPPYAQGELGVPVKPEGPQATASPTELGPEAQLALQRALAQWDEQPPCSELALEGGRPRLIMSGPELSAYGGDSPRGMADPIELSQSDPLRDSLTPVEPTMLADTGAHESRRTHRGIRGGSRRATARSGSPKRSRPYDTPRVWYQRPLPSDQESWRSGDRSMEGPSTPRSPPHGGHHDERVGWEAGMEEKGEQGEHRATEENLRQLEEEVDAAAAGYNMAVDRWATSVVSPVGSSKPKVRLQNHPPSSHQCSSHQINSSRQINSSHTTRGHNPVVRIATNQQRQHMVDLL